MSTFIAVERSDGRAGIRPFGEYGSKQFGAMVTIGNKQYKVTKDGRVNIPKAIVQKFGVKGSDGKKRLSLTFSRDKGEDGWKNVSAVVFRPKPGDKNKKTGEHITSKISPKKKDRLAPEDQHEKNWSP